MRKHSASLCVGGNVGYVPHEELILNISLMQNHIIFMEILLVVLIAILLKQAPKQNFNALFFFFPLIFNSCILTSTSQ